MAKQVNLNVTDTPISGANTPVATALNYAKDYVKSQVTPNRVVLSHSNSPFDCPSTVVYGSTPISNIYSGTQVDPSYQLPYKRGISLLGQVTQTITVTDTVDASYRVDLPYEAHCVLRVPLVSFLTGDQILNVLKRAWGTFVDEGPDGTPTASARITEMMRGALVPGTMI